MDIDGALLHEVTCGIAQIARFGEEEAHGFRQLV